MVSFKAFVKRFTTSIFTWCIHLLPDLFLVAVGYISAPIFNRRPDDTLLCQVILSIVVVCQFLNIIISTNAAPPFTGA